MSRHHTTALLFLMLLLPASAWGQSSNPAALDGTCNATEDSALADLGNNMALIRQYLDPMTVRRLDNRDDYSGGTVVIVESADDPRFVEEVKAGLKVMERTQRGREIMSELRQRGRPVRIVFSNRPPVWDPMDKQPYSVLFVNPAKVPGTITADGDCVPSSLARVLAHELGHAEGCGGETDDVNMNENPVAEALGEPARPGYPPGCEPLPR